MEKVKKIKQFKNFIIIFFEVIFIKNNKRIIKRYYNGGYINKWQFNLLKKL